MSSPRTSHKSLPERASRNVPYRYFPRRRARLQDFEAVPYIDDPPYQSISKSKQKAQNNEVFQSSTDEHPILEDHDGAETLMLDEKSRNGVNGATLDSDYSPQFGELQDLASVVGIIDKELEWRTEEKERELLSEEAKRRQRERDGVGSPTIWNFYCALVTFWCPGLLLRWLGKKSRAQQRAWREKMGLISIILLIAAFVGFLTFGFTKAICGEHAPPKKVNHIAGGYMIFHGTAYNLDGLHHPAAPGILGGDEIVYDLSTHYGGKDGSFFFQHVNGACKDLITRAPESDIPTDATGDLGWYFPCMVFKQDGSSQPNLTYPYYPGYSCHTSVKGRAAFYDLPSSGDISFSWKDVKNQSRNLLVYSGNVLDLNLLNWLDKSQVVYPPEFDQLRTNPALKGLDITRAFLSSDKKQLGQCLSEIIRVGSIDTQTIGCLATEVVLYVSLVFILALVIMKFLLALMFHWFISRRYSASKTLLDTNSKKRAQEIEEWSDDIYRPPPRTTKSSATLPDKTNTRASRFFPTTSRFTKPNASTSGKRQAPTTMSRQSSTAQLPRTTSTYQHSNGSELILPNPDPMSRPSLAASRSSIMMLAQEKPYSSTVNEPVASPGGFTDDSVVPQPPAEWEPFGYPLAHVICLITAYSEGYDGLRTTLDSVALTEYPSSHKIILIVCDGLVKGAGEDLTTPEIALSMIKDHVVLPDEVETYSYIAVASGSKRHNLAKVYSGFYDYGQDSRIPLDKQQRLPVIIVVKCGTPDEANGRKPGNRGKRDSQVILMSFLQKVMFDERMTELEFEIFNGLWKITGVSPDFYEIVLMVDADTKIYPDSLTHMVGAMVKDPELMGLCGETKISNKRATWVTMIQVFEYFISHNLSKSFESVFGAVTCLPGCFCMYRIKAPKGGENFWVPILANPDVVECYSETVVETLHKKNLLLLGEDRYLSALMLKTFPKRKQVLCPAAICKTIAPEQFSVLLSQRRRWINSTIHNLMDLILVSDLCGIFCFSMQFVIFIELVGTVVLPAAIAFTFYLIISAILKKPAIVPLVLLALILGLPAILIVLTAHHWSYVIWMMIYLLSLPIWNFVLPLNAYWKFDDFSWGETRKTADEKTKIAGIEYQGEFDSRKITMKRWGDFEKERRFKARSAGLSHYILPAD